MSHAEYASKQAPVLTRLAMLLRRIPAVQTALARLRALFGGGTNPEPVVAGTSLAGPAVTASDAVAPIDEAAAVKTPATPAPEARACEPVIVETVLANAPAVANDAVATDDATSAVACLAAPEPGEPTSMPAIVDAFVTDAPLVTGEAVETTSIAPAVTLRCDEADREALIRRRWRETGIRMWNPDVHGSGRSALCIQGRVALLPPKAGETMPRYDRLEFKLIGSDIVCEGFIVDPPERPRHRAFSGMRGLSD